MVFMVFALLMSMGAMGVFSVGVVAWKKGQLQNIADLVALTAAKQMADGPAFVEAIAVGRLNGLKPTDGFKLECLLNGQPVRSCNESISVRVTLTRIVPAVLPFLKDATVTVLAEATTTPRVTGTVASNLLNLDTRQSALLNGLLSALGGGQVNLSALQYGTLLGTNINLDLLALKTSLDVANLDELLDLRISALNLLNEALIVGNAAEADKAMVGGVLRLLKPLNKVDLKLGDLLAVNLTGQEPGPVMVNLGSLAQVALLKSVEGKSYSLPINVGLLNLSVDTRILQAPQVFVGVKKPFLDPLVEARTAQVSLAVRVRQALNLNILLVQLSALDLSLQLKVAGGLVEVNDIQCRMPRQANEVALTVVPAVAEVCIARSAENLRTSVGGLSCGAPANVLDVTLLGLVNAGVTVGASASLRNYPEEVVLRGKAPYSRTVPLSLNQTLESLLGNIKLKLGIELPVVGPLLTGVVNGLVSTLLAALGPVLSPILGVVGSILDGLLEVLGVNLNEVTVNVDRVDCMNASLTR
jgi:uncharacterized membrane protein